MINNINSSNVASENASSRINFANYLELIQKTTGANAVESQNLIASLEAAAEGGALNDVNVIQEIATANNINAQKLNTALIIINSRNKNASPELSNTYVSAPVETPEQKMARLEKENQSLKKLEPAIFKLQLATNPTKIPKFISQKFRNRMLKRKERDPYQILYYLSEGQMRRFRSNKNKMKNVDSVYNDLKIKYGPDAQANEKFGPTRSIMEKRWKVAEQAYKAVQGIKPQTVNL